MPRPPAFFARAMSVLATAIPAVLGAQTAPPRPIQDNSFLLEEAYNQEAGVIQHISAFLKQRGGKGWEYSFTEEWPAPGQRHQLSLTVPVSRSVSGDDSHTGFADLLFNYRFQLHGSGDTKVALAPRLSLVLPTGDERRGAGSGGPGVQVNFPASIVLAPALVTHLNAGATLTPSAKNAIGDGASTLDVAAGGSLIWLARSTINVMVELAWASSESVTGSDATARAKSLLVSPGIRGAVNFASGLQVVPGVAVPIGIGPSDGERYLFFYLSFEHPLWRP